MMKNEDFKAFLNGGYKKLLKELELDVYDVLKHNVPRAKAYNKIFMDYCPVQSSVRSPGTG